jgi:hypothetical protein
MPGATRDVSPAPTPAGQFWRDRAADCRREAAAHRSAESTAAWLRLAQRYEAFAEELDEAPPQAT